jgi:signal peptidase
MQKIFTIGYYILALGALGIGALLVLLQTALIPGYEVLIVQSGSMEPAIWTGSVVVVRAQERYFPGDIITFNTGGADQIPTTHRVLTDTLEAGQLAYQTQGDANDAPDPQPVSGEAVRGRVIFAIPVLGYLLDFARQPIGFALLIGVPALVIVFEEVSTIYAALRERKSETVQAEEPTTTTV